MKPSLLHPLAERRHTRRGRARGRHLLAPAKRERTPSGPAAQSAASASPAATPVRPPDAAASRVREAGGPVDRASYVCLCGFVFAAAVSTTVECPHCGAPQAW
jgi:hypothetical protein